MYHVKNIHDEYNFGDLTMYCSHCGSRMRLGNLSIRLDYSSADGEDHLEVDPNLFIRRNVVNPNETPINCICPFCKSTTTILTPTIIVDEIILLYNNGFHPIDTKFGPNPNDIQISGYAPEQFYISFESDELKVLERCWKGAMYVVTLKDSLSKNATLQTLATILGAKSINDALNFREVLLHKMDTSLRYLFIDNGALSFHNHFDIMLRDPYKIEDFKKAIQFLMEVYQIYKAEIVS